MVPRTGPLSASSALVTTSWYQRGKVGAPGCENSAHGPTVRLAARTALGAAARQSSATAHTPARLGNRPNQPSRGARPTSPEVSLANSAVSASAAPAASSAAATRAPAGVRPHSPDRDDPADAAEYADDGEDGEPGGHGRVDTIGGVRRITIADVVGEHVTRGAIHERSDCGGDGQQQTGVHRGLGTGGGSMACGRGAGGGGHDSARPSSSVSSVEIMRSLVSRIRFLVGRRRTVSATTTATTSRAASRVRPSA